jgi:hypothetical protein
MLRKGNKMANESKRMMMMMMMMTVPNINNKKTNYIRFKKIHVGFKQNIFLSKL